MTAGPTSFTEPVPTERRRLYALGGTGQSESLQYDFASRRLRSFPGRLVAFESSFTRDGQWIAYLDHSYTLWRRRADGREKRQLTSSLPEAIEPRFSPDGKRIAFSAKSDGRWQVYLVSVDGGTPEPILTGSGNRVCSDWAPDGKSLVLTSIEEIAGGAPRKTMLWILDLASRSESMILGSEGLQVGRWSPDGRYLAALTDEKDSRLMLFDRQTNQWNELARGTLLSYPAWSHDPRYVYIQDLLASGQPISRVRIADRQRELVASFEEQLGSGFVRLAFSGLTWDGVPMVWATRALSDIYAIDLDQR